MKNYINQMHCQSDDESIDDQLDRGVSEDDLREDSSTRDEMNDPDSPHYNG